MPFNLEQEIHFTLQNEKHRIPISRDFFESEIAFEPAL